MSRESKSTYFNIEQILKFSMLKAEIILISDNTKFSYVKRICFFYIINCNNSMSRLIGTLIF